MNVQVLLPASLEPRKAQQGIKWTVYALLPVNFGYYIADDWNWAAHTLAPDAGVAAWAGQFATSIDLAAWLILLFMFELETCVLEDESWTA